MVILNYVIYIPNLNSENSILSFFRANNPVLGPLVTVVFWRNWRAKSIYGGGGLPFWISRPHMHVHVCMCLYHISVRRNRDNLKRRLPNLRKYYMCVTWPRTFYFRHGFLPLSLCRTSCIIIMMMLNIINHQLPWRVSVMSESSKNPLLYFLTWL